MIKTDMNKALKRMQSISNMKGLKRGMVTGMLYLKGKLMQYPSQPSYVKSDRTGHLHRSWDIKPNHNQNSLQETAVNIADYADKVQGKQGGKNPYFRRVWEKHSMKWVAGHESKKVAGMIAIQIRKG